MRKTLTTRLLCLFVYYIFNEFQRKYDTDIMQFQSLNYIINKYSLSVFSNVYKHHYAQNRSFGVNNLVTYVRSI